MSAPDITQLHGPGPDGSAPPGAALDVVHALTGAIPQVVSVTAVVVTRGRSPFLAATLAAVRAQDRAPETVVVVDVDAPRTTGSTLDLRLDDARFVPASGARSLGEAVDAALEADAAPRDGWLWILHDDSAPEPDTLAHLLRAVEHTQAVAVAGCKQRRWPVADDGTPLDPGADRGLLVEVGVTVSPLARRMTGIDDTEIDQGQHDAREDVLAVGLAGALVRRSVWAELGGTDPEYGAFGDGLDLCRRARRAGHRVVVVPDAVVHHAQASLLGLRERPQGPPDERASQGARRRSQLHHRLVHVPAWLLPVAFVAMIVWAPVAAMCRLALKQPGAARDEIVAAVWNAVRVVPLARARRRVARSSRLPRRVLTPLLASWRQVRAERHDVRLARAEANRSRRLPTDLERAELRELARRRRAGLTLVLLAALGLAVTVFGPWQGVLAQGGRVVGGALLPAPGTLGDVWAAATTGWVEAGLGAAAPADPLLVPLTVLTAVAGGSLQLGVDLLVVVALPLAALGGWFAAGALTRSTWARGAAALAWTAAPSFLAALAGGRLGTLVAHLVLPWALVAVLRAIGVHARDVLDVPEARDPAEPAPERTRERAPRGSLGALGAAGLLLAVAVCAAPVLLPLAVVAAVLGVLAAPRHRRYLPLALLPSLVVAAPFWLAVGRTWADGGWRLLLAEPGAAVPAGAAPQPWHLLLGLPTDPAAWFGLGADAGAAARVVGLVGPFLLGGLVLLLALAALVRRHAAGGVRVAWFVALCGLAAGVLAVAAGAWPGPGASVVALGLGAAALLGARAGDAATEAEAGRARRRAARALAVVGVVVALALPAAGATSWALAEAHGHRVGDLEVTATPVVPAVGRQMQESGRNARVLQLQRDADGVVGYALLHADGTALTDASVVVRGRDAGAVPDDARAGSSQAVDERLDAVAADLAAGQAPDLATRLGDLGVGAVQVPPDADRDLVTTLDMVTGLTRVTEGDGTLLWRVAPDGEPAPGWARLTDAAPATGTRPAVLGVLASHGLRVRDAVPVASDPEATRVVVLASATDPGWHATLDGRRLAPVEADGLQAFEVPAEGGRLRVDYVDPRQSLWFTVGGAVLLVFVLLALPVGRRRGR